ncbi:hypothetical protein DPEC_G00050120 [Dallia pectoralis]|uniref:Uncharacterized protein n=1 Tax=Dallia pectoralis TaxID=75939 RepID=A0ACC2HB87_DALPE|nr:hypothetical protein DPEC_G00050120 [Dallia pectoralis]
MGRVQHHLWVTCVLLLQGGLIQSGDAQVLVEFQSGPLYRVIGYPLTISCNVSGFTNPSAQQDFRFSFYKPNKPDTEILIISTDDPNFGMATHSRRVMDGKITVERRSVTSVLFKVLSLEEGDEGVYECFTPNKEAKFGGKYNDRTSVKVIKDTLTASSIGPASLSLSEGDALTLQCLASSNTFQHTHRSVTWYLHGDGEAKPRPVISLDRNLIVTPGPGFEQRYRDGFIGLDKVEDARYRLKMSRIEMSDAGSIYCQAQEWIQDTDQSWYSMTQKDAQPTNLTVKAIEVAPDTGSMGVKIKVNKPQLQIGERLDVTCTVDVQGMTGQFFSVAWIKDDRELAKIGPTGVLSVAPEYEGQQREGELEVVRMGERTHLLTRQRVTTEDQGVFHCRAWSHEFKNWGSPVGPGQDSRTELITIKDTESDLAVAMDTQTGNIIEGGELRLICKVTGVKNQLSVTWKRRSASVATGPYSDIISLSQVGVLDVGAEFKQRKVVTLRPTVDTFVLELSDVTSSDAGTYQCTVTERGAGANHNVRSQIANVEIQSIESLLKVQLASRGAQVTVGGEADLICRVRGPNVPVNVRWSLKREGESSPEDILTLSNTGDISWRGDQSSYQLTVTTSPGQVHHKLRIIQASRREAGQYKCEITAFSQGRYREPQSSNQLAVSIQTPESALTLTSSPSLLDQSLNTDIHMECSVAKATSESSRFAVTWLAQKNEQGNQTVLSSDRDAVETLGEGLSTEPRVSMRRHEGRSFVLTIRQARSSDSGRYFCVVEEWLQAPLGQWYNLLPSSAAIELRLKETVSDLALDKTNKELAVREGDGVELTCTLTNGASDPTSLYTLTWFYMKSGSSAFNVPLVIVGHDGILNYPEDQRNHGPQDLRGRLIFSRPTHSTFQLDLQRAQQGDSGAYLCQVDQYKLSNDGQWEQTASDKSGTTNLTVKRTESALTLTSSPSLLDQSLNTDIHMECSVAKATSESSRFAVTWLAQKNEQGNQTVLSSDRDAVETLGEGLSTEPRVSMRRHEGRSFVLTIRQARSSDSGRYFCVVGEWLQDPLGQWYNLLPSSAAIELRLKETDPGSSPESGCRTEYVLTFFIPIVCLLVMLIIVLSIKLKRRGSAGNKKQLPSLWAEENPLKPVPE